MELVLGVISEAIVWTDQDLLVRWSNLVFEQMVDKPKKAIRGSSILDLLQALPRSSTDSTLAELIQDVSAEDHQVLISKHTTLNYLRSNKKYVLEVECVAVGMIDDWDAFVFVITDITQRLHDAALLQEQLLYTAKIAAIAGLTAELSHELNNPLAVILGYTQALLQYSDLDDDTRAALAEVESHALRSATVMHRLLEVARGGGDIRHLLQVHKDSI
jgi:signal transduction histidine kinase